MKKWELSILLALVLTSVWGAWSLQKQEDLSRKIIRLHVLANSDSEEDQALKLCVRDRILSYAETQLSAAEDMTDAERRLRNALPEIECMAAAEIGEKGYDYPVAVTLEHSAFPQKEYDGFVLPSGDYLALRIVIGRGGGHNWWCVVYPPLCTAAATNMKQVALAAGLTDREVALIAEENEGYVLKLRSVEIWQQIMRKLGRQT